jgi:two-component system phosphate regulon sensor histidine kinase PhoR
LIEALTLLVAVAAATALIYSIGERRRFSARFTRLVDDAERLAVGSASSSPAAVESASSPLPAVKDLDGELSRFSRALDRLAARAAHDLALVETERRKLDEILAGVPEGVLVTSSDRVPIYANRAFRDLFDIDPAAATTELLALVRRPQVHEALSRATAGEVGPAVEIQLGGREASVAARRLSDATGILLMARDVTEANRLIRMRRDFVTNLSHEIKTPLAIIRGAAETLEETGADAEAAERFVHRIIEQIYRLEDLLKDLLTLSRLESTEPTLPRQAVDLGAICRRAIEVLQPLAAREGVALRSTVESLPPVPGDGKALERMVLNLLVNAIQYNRSGGHAELRLLATGEHVVLEVEDDGVGIADVERQRVFERFYRVDKGRGRAEGGSGLGLAIVKHVAQSHGGSVEVQSELDSGSLFRVVLPVADSRPRDAALEASSSEVVIAEPSVAPRS